jgi:Methyltransferase domain
MTTTTATTAGSSSCYPQHGLRPLKNRDEIAHLLQELNFTTGVEVGVRHGEFAKHNLDVWTSCTNYKLVDLWAHQENYVDVSNYDDAKFDQAMKQAKDRLQPYQDKLEWYKMYSTEAARKIDDESLDFAYIDARHDYCGVLEDLQSYWKMRE